MSSVLALIVRFSDKLQTLKETSATKNNDAPTRYVTHSQLQIFDFDDLVKSYYHQIANEYGFTELVEQLKGNRESFLPKSADALHVSDDGKVHLVEFKINKKSIVARDVREKALESLLAFMEITETNRSFARTHVTFVVAYGEHGKQSTPSRDIINKHVAKKAGTSLIGLGLERYKGIYFKNILTMDNKDFDDYIKKEGWTSMDT